VINDFNKCLYFQFGGFKTLSSEVFKKNFEFFFFRLTLKEPILPKKKLVQFYSNKEQKFPIFSKSFKIQKNQKNNALTKFLKWHLDF
jgi:hypothetical protein